MDSEGLLKPSNAHRVRYVVIGATALPVHGYARATLDIDVFIAPTENNAARTRQALLAFGYDLTDVSGQDLLQSKVLIRQYLERRTPEGAAAPSGPELMCAPARRGGPWPAAARPASAPRSRPWPRPARRAPCRSPSPPPPLLRNAATARPGCQALARGLGHWNALKAEAASPGELEAD
jgi:hypothetical protein